MSIHVAPGSVVVGYDGSDHAERALRWAADQAALEHRTLDVVHAVDVSEAQLLASGAMGAAAVLTADLVAAAQPLLEVGVAHVRTRHPELQVHSEVLESDARTALLDLSLRAHMVVVGSRGRGRVRRLVLGSVSAAVARHAACPVVIVREVPTDSETDGVVVGADGTPESTPVLEKAFELASYRGLPLTVVHSTWDAAAEDGVTAMPLLLSQSVAGMRDRYPQVAVTLLPDPRPPDRALTPSSMRWAVVVVGHQQRNLWRRGLLGSVSQSVIERSDAPVVVVPQAVPETTTSAVRDPEPALS